MIEIIPNWHPMFVHFTVAMFIISCIAFLVAQFGHNYNVRYQARVFARWNLWIGMALTVLTVGAGFYAFNTVDHDDPSHLAMIEHRNWALITFITFLSLSLLSLVYTRKDHDEGVGFVGVMLVAVLLLGSTAWHGAELVYRHGLGVMSLPKVSGEGHGHEGHSHGDSAAPAMAPTVPSETAAPIHNEHADDHHEHKEKANEPKPSDHHDDGHDHQH